MEVSSRELKHRLVRLAVIDSQQTVKLIIDASRLEGDHGVPDYIIRAFPDGIPLDLNPRFPLRLMVDDLGLSADLSFRRSGLVTCFINWDAVVALAIGLGGVLWEHEANQPDLMAKSEPAPRATSDGNTVIDLASRRKK